MREREGERERERVNNHKTIVNLPAAALNRELASERRWATTLPNSSNIMLCRP